jgi:hypothetical protein
MRHLASAHLSLLLSCFFAGCGDPGPEESSLGLDTDLQGFENFGAYYSVRIGVDTCAIGLNENRRTLLLTLPGDAAPGDYPIDATLPFPPPSGVATASITESYPPEGEAPDNARATGGKVTVRQVAADRIVADLNVEFGEERFVGTFDAGPCT